MLFGLRHLWKRLAFVRVRNCQQTTDKVFEHNYFSAIKKKNFNFAPHILCGEVEAHLYVLLTWAPEIGEWLYSRSDPIALGERAPGSSWVGWLSRKACHTLWRREKLLNSSRELSKRFSVVHIVECFCPGYHSHLNWQEINFLTCRVITLLARNCCWLALRAMWILSHTLRHS